MRRDLLLLVLGTAAGWGLHWWAYRPVPIKADTPKPEIIINERTRVVTRVIYKDLLPSPWEGKEVVRSIEVVAMPAEPGKAVTVTVDLVKDDDGSLRAVAKADGVVVAATDKVRADVAVRVVEVEKPDYKWAAGVVYGAETRGVFLTRDFGRIRLGAEAARTQQPNGWDARVSLGVRW